MSPFELFPTQHDEDIEHEDSSFEDETLDDFVALLDKEPAASEIIQEVKMRFNQLESVTKRSFDDALESARPKERIRAVDMYAQRSALDYISLHKNIQEMLELAEHLSDEEKQEVLNESEQTAVFFEGHTLLAFYANRNGLEQKKGFESRDRNTENAALQQYMAKYYLRHQDKIPELDDRLDRYGRKAFGSSENYVRFKKGVVSLADAYNHLEEMGHSVFFPPARLDAESAIDLISVPKYIYADRKDDVDDFIFDNPTMRSIASLDPSLRESLYGVQVKTRGRLRETYRDVGSSEENLESLLDTMSLDRRFLDGVDKSVLDQTQIHMSETESVIGSSSRAAVFSCGALSERSFAFNGYSTEREAMKQSLDRKSKDMVDDVQELGMFMGKKDMGTMYVLVDSSVADEFYSSRPSKKI